MTDLDLDAIEARANAATDGPWLGYDERSDLREENPDVTPMWVVAQMEPDGVNWVRDIADIGGGEQDEADAEFIAHARTDLPALVAALREARAALLDPDGDLAWQIASAHDAKATEEFMAEGGKACCNAHGYKRERDDWRRRYEALRDGVTGLCDEADRNHEEYLRGIILDRFIVPSNVTVRDLRAVVARVEGGES